MSERLHQLVESGDTEALEQLLRDQPELRDAYIDLLILDGHLTFEIGEAPTVSASAPTDATANNRFQHSPWLLGLAAVVMLVAGAAAVYMLTIVPPQIEVEKPQASTRLATLIDATGTVVINNKIGNPGEDYAAGSYSIDSGSAELLLTNHVGVQMRGRTELSVHHKMASTLHHGTATFNCPVGAIGYTVRLPDGSSVVDLGTRFTVTVLDDDHMRVTVLDGVVNAVSSDQTELTLGTNDTIEMMAGRWVAPAIATVSNTQPQNTFSVASDDLLQTSVASRELNDIAAESGVFGGQHVDSLTNGPAVWHPNPRQTIESYSTRDGGSVTWHLDTDASPAGYTIDRIAVLAGCWPTRTGHLYTIEIARVGDDDGAYTTLIDVDHPDNLVGQSHVVEQLATIERGPSEPLAERVRSIRITFRDDDPRGQKLGESVFREIDVIGSPTRPTVTSDSNHSTTHESLEIEN